MTEMAKIARAVLLIKLQQVLKRPRWSRVVVCGFLALLLPCLSGAPALAAGAHPTPVSPGAKERVTAVSEVCPTFNWAGVEGAIAYELAVFAAPSLPADAAPSHPGEIPLRPILQQRIPGGALGWTPPAGRCLQRGGTYGWLVRAVFREGPGTWSEPHSFRVHNPVSEEEVRNALEVLRGYLGQERDDQSARVAGDSAVDEGRGPVEEAESRQGRPVALSGLDTGYASAASLTLGTTGSGPPPPPPPPPIGFFSVDHTGSVSAPNVRANFFAGDGAAVTNVNALRWGGLLYPGGLVDSTHSHPVIPAGVCSTCRFRPVPGCAELCEVHHPTTDALEARCHVRVFDSGGPSADYGNGENALLNLCWPNQRPFELFLNTFATEDSKDFLYVFDGLGNPTNRCAATPPVPDTNQTLLATLTGNMPGQFLQSTRGCLALLFCSDGANTDVGWEGSLSSNSSYCY